jgi:hypothetical protein
MEIPENIYSSELLEIFKEHEHYKVFPLIYSIKDTLNKYYQYPEDLCQLCFMTCIDSNNNDSDSDDINMNMILVNNLAQTEYPEQLLCNKCTSTFSKMDVLNLIQEILNETYHNEGNERFNEFIKLFRTIGFEYVMNPYEKLLTTYFSYDMGNYYSYHKKCSHFTGISNKCDNVDILCPFILDIIEHIDDLYFTNYLYSCPLQYMEILIKKGNSVANNKSSSKGNWTGIDINYIFNLSKHMGNQTVFGSLLYSYLDDDRNNIIKRIDKLISLGTDVNIGNPIRYITGIQYENRPYRIEKIKYLKNIGVKFDNMCITNCSSVEECKFHKMLYDTRLGKLIQSLS